MTRASLRLLVITLLVMTARDAFATWSIVGVDPRTEQVGVAGASCILGSEVLGAVVPGRGAIAAQAWANVEARDRMAGWLREGESPEAVLARVTNRKADGWLGIPTYTLRQYGVVALGSHRRVDVANFTGSWAFDWAGAETTHGASVQGNLLRGPEVVEAARRAWDENPRVCLAERLLRALEAGAEAGGDRRCAEELTALSAILWVAVPEDRPDAPTLRLTTSRPGEPPFSAWKEIRRMFFRPQPGTAEESPVRLLREAFDRSRTDGAAASLCPR